MKKVFPLIVVLISLSVVGILFIQISWINNAIKLKHEEFTREVDNALKESVEAIQNQFLSKQSRTYVNQQSRKFALQQNFTTQRWFTQEELYGIIDGVIQENKVLRESNSKKHFEFCIQNIFKNPVFISSGFNLGDMESSFSRVLVDNSTMNQETLFLDIQEDKNSAVRQMWWIILASFVFTIIIISAFVVTVRTLFNQKKISEIKSDFINNMTHELKTPLATISLAIDALTNEKVIHDAEKVKIYSAMIKEENKRMNKQVEKILQAARLEKEEIKLTLQKLDTHQVISKVADNLALQIQERNGTLTLKLNASNPAIDADEVHFSNIIFNLLDNAMKYSSGAPHIEVETFSHGNGMLSIKVKDNGIGMDKETQTRIFEKFYRAHTGNLHNVKGFGLGLSYVKGIIDAHDGRIKVESAPGKGSAFTITLPQQAS